MIRRYLVVVGLILAVLVTGGIATKPKPAELKRDVETAMSAYAKARAHLPDDAKDLSLPVHVARTHDYLVATSYEATADDGARFSCVGAFFVTVCTTPDEPK
jgi:hypothetical protein